MILIKNTLFFGYKIRAAKTHLKIKKKMEKIKIALTKCPRQRFPRDRKFKDVDNPITNKETIGNGK